MTYFRRTPRRGRRTRHESDRRATATFTTANPLGRVPYTAFAVGRTRRWARCVCVLRIRGGGVCVLRTRGGGVCCGHLGVVCVCCTRGVCMLRTRGGCVSCGHRGYVCVSCGHGGWCLADTGGVCVCGHGGGVLRTRGGYGHGGGVLRTWEDVCLVDTGGVCVLRTRDRDRVCVSSPGTEPGLGPTVEGPSPPTPVTDTHVGPHVHSFDSVPPFSTTLVSRTRPVPVLRSLTFPETVAITEHRRDQLYTGEYSRTGPVDHRTCRTDFDAFRTLSVYVRPPPVAPLPLSTGEDGRGGTRPLATP